MNANEAPDFEQILETLFLPHGRKIDKPLTRVWWAAMQDLTLDQFSSAAAQYIMTGDRPPVPANIRNLASQFPTPEEAWNRLPKTEGEAGWTCPEIDTAMGACWDSLERGDMVAARMAFKGVYEREIQGKVCKPQWRITEASSGDHVSRMRRKLELLEQHPDRNPEAIPLVRAQLEELTGSQRRGGGLKLAANNVPLQLPGKAGNALPEDYLSRLKEITQ